MFASTCSRHVARRFFNSVQVIVSFGDRLMTIESLKKIKLFGLRSGRQPLFYQDALLPDQSSRPCPQRVEQLDSIVLEPFRTTRFDEANPLTGVECRREFGATGQHCIQHSMHSMMASRIVNSNDACTKSGLMYEGLEVKITDTKVFVLNSGRKASWGTGWDKNTILVKLYTDEGIDGLGEGFHSLDEPIEGALDKFKRWLVGQDPTRILRNWQAIYRGLRYPLGTAELSALSAVEQALWDISGKACGLPVYKMLGGPTRDRIRVYASGRLCQPRHFDLPGEDLVGACQQCVEAGFTAVKFTPQPDDYAAKSPEQIHRDAVQRVRTVREAVGPSVDICLDYHGRSFSVTEAVRLAQEIEPFRPMFLEEPALTENPDALVEAKTKTSIPIAGGERCISRDRLRDILQKQAVHILQPEPTANGGILETVKWASMCELYHIVLAPHQACGPVSLLACAHIDASITNFLIQECNVDVGDPFYKDLFSPMPVIKDGYLELPDRPGLGIELNEEAVEKYPRKPFDRPVIVSGDGGIGLE